MPEDTPEAEETSTGPAVLSGSGGVEIEPTVIINAIKQLTEEVN